MIFREDSSHLPTPSLGSWEGGELGGLPTFPPGLGERSLAVGRRLGAKLPGGGKLALPPPYCLPTYAPLNLNLSPHFDGEFNSSLKEGEWPAKLLPNAEVA